MYIYHRLGRVAVLAGILAWSCLPSASWGAAKTEDATLLFKNIDACWKAARNSDPAAYECLADNFMRNDNKEIAVHWYAKAAEYGRQSARNKLLALGIEANPERSEPMPSCKATYGEGTVSGLLLKVTQENDGHFEYVFKEATGKRVMVHLPSSLSQLPPDQSGSYLSLGYSREQRLMTYTAQCRTDNYYIPDSWVSIAAPKANEVYPLPRVTKQDVACNGAVDEAALLTQLNEWIQKLSAAMRMVAALPPDQIDQRLISDKSPLVALRADPVLQALHTTLEPVRCHLVEMGAVESLDEHDRHVLSLLENYGLSLLYGEGYIDLIFDDSFFYVHLQHLSDNMGLWYTTVGYAVPDTFTASNGLVRFSLDALVNFARYADNFLVLHSSSPYAGKVRAQYRYLMEHILFGDPPSISPFGDDGLMDEDWLSCLKAFGEYPKHTAAILREYCAAVKANSGKQLSPQQKQHFRDLIASL